MAASCHTASSSAGQSWTAGATSISLTSPLQFANTVGHRGPFGPHDNIFPNSTARTPHCIASHRIAPHSHLLPKHLSSGQKENRLAGHSPPFPRHTFWRRRADWPMRNRLTRKNACDALEVILDRAVRSTGEWGLMEEPR